MLLVVAAAVDGYLLWVSGSAGGVAGCGPESGCHVVLNSRWAYWFGIPVSGPALLVYAALLTGSLWLEPNTSARCRARAWRLLWPCAVAVLGAGLWFVSLQVFVLRTICPVLHGRSHLRHGSGGTRPVEWRSGAAYTGKRARSRIWGELAGKVIGLTGMAMIALAILAIGQTLHTPATYLANPITAGIQTNMPNAAVRQFQIHEGQFQFQLNEVPLIGKPEAEHVIVSLFDYTCHHCRQVHPLLLNAQRQFSNRLAIISLPMPLDSQCNPRIRRTQPPHTNACALARLGLTVWAADRTKLAAFDLVFAPDSAPLPLAAEAYARDLVGSQAFARASTNPGSRNN